VTTIILAVAASPTLRKRASVGSHIFPKSPSATEHKIRHFFGLQKKRVSGSISRAVEDRQTRLAKILVAENSILDLVSPL
jgi:hypothetical protein